MRPPSWRRMREACMVRVLVNVRSGSDYDVAVCVALVRGNFEGLGNTIHVNTLPGHQRILRKGQSFYGNQQVRSFSPLSNLELFVKLTLACHNLSIIITAKAKSFVEHATSIFLFGLPNFRPVLLQLQYVFHFSILNCTQSRRAAYQLSGSPLILRNPSHRNCFKFKLRAREDFSHVGVKTR